MIRRAPALLGIVLGFATLTCTTSSDGPCGVAATCPGVDMYWASYQMNSEPHYRLIFEGGVESRALTEVRIRDAVGSVIARANVVPSEQETLRLCAGGITRGVPVTTPVPTYRPGLYGPDRATVLVSESVFREFIRDASPYKVEALVGSTWMQVAPHNLCHAQE
jgi:hypothetical protein